MTETHPDSIGPYRVLRPLARGGMAAVYEVEDPETGHRVALKLLTQRGMARPRFQREYRALTRMHHPHIVRVYRFGVDEEGRPYLTMELLDGQPAQVYAKALGRPGTPMRTMQVLRIATEIAGALGYLHDRGIVHRDLKSANVMVLSSGTARLLDFGTARWLVTDEQLTRHGEFVGTFAYAPPEQLTGSTVDARSDLYSLGVLIYRLLTGKRPFEADSPKELARLHMEHVPPPPGSLVSGVPPSVSALTMSLLSKDRDDRPSSAWIVRDRLEAAVEAGASAPKESESRPPELLGRQTELNALQAFLAQRGPGTMLVVAGPPGSGRERFLLHATQRAQELEHRVLEAAFSAPSGLTALGDIARQAGRGLALDPMASESLQRVSQAAAAVHRPGGREVLGRAWARLLAVRSQRDAGPVVVLLHRLHRADPAALETLRSARETLAEEGFPVLFVGSCAKPALAPTLPLARALRPDTTLSIGPVQREDMGRLVSAVLGHRPPPLGVTALVHEACGGLPGHAVAVLNAMIREGLLSSTEDEEGRRVWVDCSGGRVSVPSRIAEDLKLRLSSLEAGPRRVAEALSLAGQPVDRAVLARACQFSLQDVDEALKQLSFGGLAESDASARWTLPFGIAVQVLREELRDSKRRILRTELAAALHDAPATAEKVRLLLEAGDEQRALSEGIAWAEGAVRGDVSPGSVALLSRIVSACSKDAAGSRMQRAQLLALYGRAATRADVFDPRGMRALEAAEELDEPSILASVEIERAARHRAHGEAREANASLLRARQRLRSAPSPVLEVRVNEEQAWLLEAQGDSLGAISSWRAAEKASDNEQSQARSRVGAARCMASAGQVRAAHSECESVWLAGTQTGHLAGTHSAALQLSRLLRLQARFSEAQGLVEPLVDPVRAAGEPRVLGFLLVELAQVRMDLLRLGEVRELLTEAATLSAIRTHPRLAALLAEARVRLELLSGAPELAADQAQPALRAAQRAGLSCIAESLRALLGEALVSAGDHESGDLALRTACRALQEMHNLPALGMAVAARQRATSPTRNPDPIWSPVADWLDREPLRGLALERALARRANALQIGDDGLLAEAEAEAKRRFSEIERLQAPSDRPALRVHPWHTLLSGNANTSPHQ